MVKATSSLLLLCSLAVAAQTNISIPAASGGGIQAALPASPGGHVFGMNLDGSYYYGNNQLAANLISSDGAQFTPQVWMQSSVATSCPSATTWVDGNQYSPQPANFWQGATYQVVSGADAGNTGTITASAAASGGSGQTFTLSPGLTTACSNGDVMIERCPTALGTCAGGLGPGNGGVNLGFGTSGGGSYQFETTDLSPSSASPQALELIAPGSAQSYIGPPFDPNSNSPWINLNGTYTLTFRAKATSGTPTLAYRVTRLGGTPWLNSSVTPTVNSTPGAGWTNYSFSFTASEMGAQNSTGFVYITASGGTVLLQDVALTENGTGGNTTAFRNAVYQRLLALKPGILRMMYENLWGVPLDGVISGAPPLTGFNSYGQYGGTLGYNLNQFLYLAAQVGADPWFTFSAYYSTTDMQNMAAYFNAPCSSGNHYATIRCNFLASTPYAGETWTQVFNHIYLEMGNEIWNSPNGEQLYAGGGTVYGSILAQSVVAFKGAPYYNSKMKVVGSGWQSEPSGCCGWNPNVLNTAQAAGGLPDYIDGATYVFGYLTDTSSAANIFGPMYAEPVNTNTVSSGNTNQLESFAKTYGIQAAVYESNIGTTCGITGITQSQINQVVAGIGSGLDATLNMLLGMRDAGILVQNMFALPENANTFNTAASTTSGSCSTYSGVNSPVWGSVLLMPGPSDSNVINRPTGIAMQMVNAAVLPNLLNVVQTGTPTYNQPAAQPIPGTSASITATCNGTTTISSISITSGNLIFWDGPVYLYGSGVPAGTEILSYNSGAGTGLLSAPATCSGTTNMQALNQNIQPNSAVPYVQAFGFGDGAGNYSLIVYNLNLTTAETVSYSGAGAPTGAAIVTEYGGAQGYALTGNNEGLMIGGTPVVAYPSSSSTTCPTSIPAYSIVTCTYTLGAASGPTAIVTGNTRQTGLSKW